MERQGTLDDGKPGPVEAFTVTDSGIGFTDNDFDSFETVDSPYKAPRGGKGLGRFLWLKAFARVEIESHFRTAGADGLIRRKFSFVANEDDLPRTALPSERKTPETVVRLVGFRTPYIDECPRPLDIIAQRLIGHFLPLYLDPNGPALALADGAGKIDLRAFFRENFQSFASERKFSVGQQQFTLSGFRLRGVLADHHECQIAFNCDPLFACNTDPLAAWGLARFGLYGDVTGMRRRCRAGGKAERPEARYRRRAENFRPLACEGSRRSSGGGLRSGS